MSQRRTADCHNQTVSSTSSHRYLNTRFVVCVCALSPWVILTLVTFWFDVSLIVGMGTLICSYSYAHLRLSRGFVVVCLLLYEHVCNHLNVHLMSSCHAMVLDFRCLTSNNLFHTIYGLHDLQHRAQYVIHYDINTERFFHNRVDQSSWDLR